MQRFIKIAATVLLLSGCASPFSKDQEAAALPCPKAGFIADTDSVSFPATKTDPAVNVVMNGFSAECSFKDKNKVQIDLTLPFVAKKTPADDTSMKGKEVSYFIAVLSPEDKVLQRQKFSATVPFDKGDAGSSKEEHTITIPLTPGAEARQHKIAIGFALTPDQLKQNEERK